MKNEAKSDLINLDPKLVVELLKQKIDIGYGLLPRYITVFAIYVAIIGTLLKFAFDSNSTPNLRFILSTLGIAFSFIALLGPYYGEMMRKQLVEDIKNYQSLLGKAIIKDELLHLKYTAITACVFVIFTILGLSILLFFNNII